LWRQPGWLAAIAVAASLVHFLLVLILDDYLTATAGKRLSSAGGLLALGALHIPVKSSCTVAAMWGALALSGRWKAEKSWIDRTGRVLGWYWIFYPAVTKLFLLL